MRIHLAAKNRLLFALLLLAAPAALSAATLSSFGGEALSFSGAALPEPAASVAASLPAAQAAGLRGLPLPQKKYTVILFMNGKNNLGVFMARKLRELEKVGSDANINIVADVGLVQPVQACSTCPVTNMYGASWEGVRRYYVVRNPAQPAAAIATSVRLPLAANTDMGDYKSLVSLVNWSKTNLPAEKYIVVVGNHGGAWVDRQKKLTSAKGVSYDDVTGNYITTPEIGLALKEFGGADVLIFDDCLMQTAEVASEIRDNAAFVLGSEEISYTNHFKPAELFLPLKANPNMSPAAFVDGFMKTWAAYNSANWAATKRTPGTFSLIVPARITGLEAAAKKYAEAALALEGAEAKLAYREAMRDVLRYHYAYCADLHDFVELAQQKLAAKIAAGKIAESPKTRALDLAAEELKSYITGRYVLTNFTSGGIAGKDYAKSHGVSIYLPAIKEGTMEATIPTFYVASPNLLTKYTDLQFDKNTGWSRFIKYLLTKDTPR